VRFPQATRRPRRQVERPERQYGFVAKCVAGTIVDGLCELGRGETLGTTPWCHVQ
jgi:hypothetical protein